jgi:sugar/nucleoside kinase (ribokinase family)
VRLVGVVGGDFGDEHVEFLRGNHVDLSGLERVPGGKTFRWSGEYSADMNQRQTLSVELNVFDGFQPKIPETFKDSRLVFLANGSPVTQMSVLDQVRRPAFVVADTMDLWIRTQNDALRQLLARLDALFVNDSEAILLTGARGVIEAGRAIQQMGPPRVVVKKGEHGCILFDGEDAIPLPAYPVADVRDPTGAGDSFAGAFMGYLAGASSHLERADGTKGGPFSTRILKSALAYGTVAASFTVEDFGVRGIAQAKQPDARKRFEKYREFLTL